MIIKEEIHGRIFIEQRTYYIYDNEDDYKNDKKTLVTSDEKIFNKNKASTRKLIHL